MQADSSVLSALYSAAALCMQQCAGKVGRTRSGSSTGGGGGDNHVVQPAAGLALDENSELRSQQADVQVGIQTGLRTEDQPVYVLPVQM